MKNIILVYTPFCTPVTPPYSITHLYSFLKANTNENIKVLDLNVFFHKKRFSEYHKFYSDVKWDDYEGKTSEFNKLTKKCYSENNKIIVDGGNPELFDELLQKIKHEKPDIVAFSVVYSSQAFYVYSLLKELKKCKDIVTVIGGPAVNEKLKGIADKSFNNEVEFLNYVGSNDNLKCNNVLDFSVYDLNDYFIPKNVIPIKTTSTCFYKKCSFCSHFSSMPYFEYPLDVIKDTVINSKQKYFFLIDDMIHTKRLLELAEIFKPLNIKWTCQLRPTCDLDFDVLKKLNESGLIMVVWGVESGNDRVLKLINKGTNVKDIQNVLKNSHDVGIKNVAYIIFGFPTETKEEFIETIEFLKENEEYIDLVSNSVFGLQKGTIIYESPSKFGITNIVEEKRTILEPKLSYCVDSGLSQKEAIKLRDNYKKTFEKINKFPKSMNYFREHMFVLIK